MVWIVSNSFSDFHFLQAFFQAFWFTPATIVTLIILMFTDTFSSLVTVQLFVYLFTFFYVYCAVGRNGKIYLMESYFYYEFFSTAFAGDLSLESEGQVSGTLLSILPDLNNAVVWMVSSRLLISYYSSPFTKPLGIVLSFLITINTTVIFMFLCFFYFSGAKAKYSFLFCFLFFFLSVVRWNSRDLYSASFLFLTLYTSVFLSSGRH